MTVKHFEDYLLNVAFPRSISTSGRSPTTYWSCFLINAPISGKSSIKEVVEAEVRSPNLLRAGITNPDLTAVFNDGNHTVQFQTPPTFNLTNTGATDINYTGYVIINSQVSNVDGLSQPSKQGDIMPGNYIELSDVNGWSNSNGDPFYTTVEFYQGNGQPLIEIVEGQSYNVDTGQTDLRVDNKLYIQNFPASYTPANGVIVVASNISTSSGYNFKYREWGATQILPAGQTLPLNFNHQQGTNTVAIPND